MPPDQVDAGQAVYTRHTLKFYDFVVLGFSNRIIWQCPTSRLLEHYNRHITANHLDVGVGTGYFLDRCHFPNSEPRITLMDLNRASLRFASRRIARYRPQIIRHNVLEPLPCGIAKFDSVGVNYLLHCVPGTMESKAIVFDNLRAAMNPGGVLFGATLLQGGVRSNWLARWLMTVYNRQGIFSNDCDDLHALEKSLRDRFGQVTFDVVGCAAVFAGRL